MVACRCPPPKCVSGLTLMLVQMIAPHSCLPVPMFSQARKTVSCYSVLGHFISSLEKKTENKGSSDIKTTLFFLFATAEAASGHCCHLPSSEPPNRHLPQRCPTTARVHQSPALLFHTRIMDLTVPHNLPYLILQHPIFSLFSAAPRFSFSYPITYSLDAVQTSADLKCPCNVLLILWLNNKKSTE